jgi:hypothetical protein
MPIKPENLARYPANWKEIRAAILERAGHCCEGSPAHPDCRAANYEPHPETGSLVVLTIGHLDHTPEHCNDDNLAAWCQRCHLENDAEHHRLTAWKTRHNKKAIRDLFEPEEATA